MRCSIDFTGGGGENAASLATLSVCAHRIWAYMCAPVWVSQHLRAEIATRNIPTQQTYQFALLLNAQYANGGSEYDNDDNDDDDDETDDVDVGSRRMVEVVSHRAH